MVAAEASVASVVSRGRAGRSRPRRGSRRPGAPADGAGPQAAPTAWSARSSVSGRPRRRPVPRPRPPGHRGPRGARSTKPEPSPPRSRCRLGEARQRRQVPAHEPLLGEDLRVRVLGGQLESREVQPMGGVLGEEPAEGDRSMGQIPLARLARPGEVDPCECLGEQQIGPLALEGIDALPEEGADDIPTQAVSPRRAHDLDGRGQPQEPVASEAWTQAHAGSPTGGTSHKRTVVCTVLFT